MPVEDSGVNAFTPRSQQLRNRLCVGPSVRHASFIPLVTFITLDIYMHTYVRIAMCRNWIWLDRVTLRDVTMRMDRMLPSIFFRTEIRDEYETDKRAAVFIGSLSFRTNNLLEQKNEPTTSTQKSHLRLSYSRKPGS